MQHRKTILLVLAGPLFMGVISLLAWVFLGGALVRAPQQIAFVIPDGTATRVQAGQSIPSIPAKSVFQVGDMLELRNDDKVNHQVGPFTIPANETIFVPLDQASSYSFVCTVHPSGSIGLEVRPANSLLLTLVPTLGLGLPMGVALAIIARVLSRLDVS